MDDTDANEVTEIDPAELYHENSKLRRSDGELFGWIQFYLQSPELQRLSARAYKHHRGAPRVALPPPADLPEATRSFDAVVLGRRSDRAYRGEVPLAALSKMLHHGYGDHRTEPLAATSTVLHRKPVPSAGALYPLEVYLFAFEIAGLAPGTYHYHPRAHALELLVPGDRRARVLEMAFAGDELGGAAGVIALTGVFARSTAKYRKRAYRFVLLEAGHAAQNMMLAAASMDLGTVALGGFLDDEVNDALDIDGLDEAALYLLAFGVPAR